MFDKFTIVNLVKFVIWNCIRYPEVPRSHLDVVLMLPRRDREEVEADPRPKFSVTIQCGVILDQRELNPFNPPGKSNIEHVNKAKPAMRVHCVTLHASPRLVLSDR